MSDQLQQSPKQPSSKPRLQFQRAKLLSDQLQQSPEHPSSKPRLQFQRVKLLSHAEVVEKWTTTEMPRSNGTKQLGNLQIPSQLEQKQSEKVGLKSLAPSWKPETFGYDIDADPEIEKYATIQMQVLKGIAKRQDQPGSSMQSEIT